MVRVIKKIKSNLGYLIKLSFFIFFRIFPVRKNKVIFLNTNSHLSGPLKAVYEELTNKGFPSNDIVILSNNTSNKDSNLSIKYGSIRSFFEIVTSKVWISDSRQQAYFRKRRDQFYIMTWHGSAPIKFIEKDAVDTLPQEYIKCAKNDSRNIDLMVAQSKHINRIMKNSFWYDGDILQESFTKEFYELSNNQRREVYSHFNISNTKKMILYVPTFRNNSSINCYSLDYQGLIKKLNYITNNEYVIIVRLHENAIRFMNSIDYDENVLNGSKYPSVEKLISASDLVITDYSGCLFKSYYANKRTILYVPDFEEYVSTDRGTYYDLKKMPSPIVESEEQIVEAIVSYNENEYISGRNQILEQLGYYGGSAEKTIVKRILEITSYD